MDRGPVLGCTLRAPMPNPDTRLPCSQQVLLAPASPPNTALCLSESASLWRTGLCGLSPQPLMRSCSELYCFRPRGWAQPQLTTTWRSSPTPGAPLRVFTHPDPPAHSQALCTHASDAHWCAHTCRIQGVTRSRHPPARCTPAVNQCLGGAAGATTPRERRAAKGHPGCSHSPSRWPHGRSF